MCFRAGALGLLCVELDKSSLVLGSAFLFTWIFKSPFKLLCLISSDTVIIVQSILV